MMKLKLLFTILIVFVSLILNAQQVGITGTVTDAKDGSPLPGVTVMIDKSTIGTVTDIDGKYNLKQVSQDATLSFSFLGYTSKKIPVGGQTVISVSLQEDVLALDEVVVTGYGTSKKKDLTGALATLKGDDLNKSAATTPEQMLQGKVSGVQIVSNNGEPGSGSQIRIRGASTIRGGQQPLIVVDGVPLDMQSTSPDGISGNSLGGAPATSALTSINPNDIESMDILKDASAAAIYGSRGANGVILITTKKGKEGSNEVNYSSTYKMSYLPKKLTVLSAAEWVKLRKDSLGTTDSNFGHSTDWQDQIFKTAYSQDQNLSMSGGTSKSAYRASFNYTDQEGIIKTSDMKRYTGRLNLTQKTLNDKLSIEANLTGSEVIENRAPVGASGFEGDALLNALQANPTWPVRDSVTNELFQTKPTNERNPLAMLEYTQDLTRTTNVMGNVSANLEIFKGLNYKINFGMDYTNANRFINQSQKLNYQKIDSMSGGTGQINNKEIYNYLIEHTLNYNFSLGENAVTLLGGYSYQDFNERGNNTTASKFATEGILYTNNLQNSEDPLLVSIKSWADNYKMQSFFGRINYNLKEKYLATATLRADGSSKFGVNNKYGYFPSMAFGWRVSEEDFIKSLNFFSNLKLRIGWGETGNSDIPTRLSQPLYKFDPASKTIIGTQLILGLIPYSTPNPDLTWETTTSTNFGFDFGILKGLLSGSVDYYNKSTTNLLLNVPTASPAQTAEVYRNISSCSIVNKGLELSLTGIPVPAWEITGNITFMSNVVNNLPVKQYPTGYATGQGLTGAYVEIVTSGQPMNVFYGNKIDSLVGKKGYTKYVKGPNKKKDTLMYLGSPYPDFIWSLNNTFKYKNFDLNVFIEGVYGNKIFNNTALLLDKGNLGQSKNSLKDLTYDKMPLPGFSTIVSDRYVEDGSYVRLSNVTLGYNMNFTNNYVKHLRVFASGSNLFVITKYTGYDPDVTSSKDLNGISSTGIDITNYPKARTYSIGLNVTF